MSKIYKVGVVFEFDPENEHDFLFEGLNEEQKRREMIRLVNADIANGGCVVEIVSIEGETD